LQRRAGRWLSSACAGAGAGAAVAAVVRLIDVASGAEGQSKLVFGQPKLVFESPPAA
jgi:hypothetical protein